MKNRILAGIMALSLTLAPFAGEPAFIRSESALTVHAEETAHVWDGTADTSWYTAEHQTAMIGDQEWSYYEISTPEQLAGLSELVRGGNTMENTSIALTNDIVLNDVSNYDNWWSEPPANNWIPIGAMPEFSPGSDSLFSMYVDTGIVEFKGVFDGGGHTIKGLYCHHDCLGGLFAECAGAVSRVRIENGFVLVRSESNSAWSTHAGGISARSDQAVFNMCEYYGYVGSERNGYPTARSGACAAGGIVGYADDQGAEWLLSSMILLPFGVIINPLLLYAGTEHGTVTRQGIYNCISRGIVATAGGATGGILGWGNTGEALRHTLIVKNCFHEGKVDPNGGGKAGGIVGRAYKFDIKNCYYRGCNQGFVVDIGGSMDSEEAYSYETLGMTKAEVAEKLGSCFLYVNDDIQLNFVPTDSSEPVTETTEPAAETTEPVTETTEPAAETTEPAAETTEPVTEAPTEPQKPLAPSLACYPTTYEEKPVVMLKWNMIDGIAGYEYQISADPDFAGSQPYTVENTYNSVSLNNNATPGTTYYLRVRTYLETENGRLYSDYANTQFTAPVLAENAELAAPVMKTAVLNNDNKFTIYWGKAEGADSYEIDTATDRHLRIVSGTIRRRQLRFRQNPDIS